MSAHTVNTSFNNNLKILVVYSSPKKDGNTKKLLDAFLSQCPQNAQIAFYSAYELDAKPCIDCGFCKENKNCTFDDLNEFYNDFETCDLIVIATPIYNYSYPSPLKAIFDRFQPYYNARFFRNQKQAIIKNRKAVVISTCGSNENTGFDIIEYQTKRSFTVLNVELVGSLNVKNTDKINVEDFEIQKAKELAISVLDNFL